MSLRFRINLVIALSMLVIVLVGAVFTIYKARNSVQSVMTDSMDLATRSIEDGIHNPMAKKSPARFWQTRMGLSAGTQRLRMRIGLPDGRTIEYNGAWALQPSSPAPDWFIWLIKPGLLIDNRLIETDMGPIRVTMRVDPTDEIAKSWKSAQALFGLVFLQALLVGVLVHFTLRKAFRSVPIILKGLDNIKKSNFSERLPDFEIPEFSKISNAFNYAASDLEQAHNENRALTSRTLTAQEEERRMLARELPDELGQSLTGIKMTASSINKKDPADQAAVDSILSICDHLFLVVRSMMRRLRPTLLDDLGLAASLQDMIDNWMQQNTSTKVNHDVDDRVEGCDEVVKIHLFRIVQEALNNVARHAKAKKVEITIAVKNCESGLLESDNKTLAKRIYLSIKDDGLGFDVNNNASGFGLLGMRERAESINGSLSLQSIPEHGVTIDVELPFSESLKC